MRPGEAFELQCYEHLKRTYETAKTKFYHEGGMNSTTSDIEVIKNGITDFYIEAKDSLAQSGQFVLLPNEETEEFIFSPRNKSEQNEMTDIIIEYMNNNFHRFNNAGTAGQSLGIDTNIFADWIIEHYINKNVKFVISYGRDYVILPIHKFSQYFQINATYRIKKSGSRESAIKDMPVVKDTINHLYPSAMYSHEGKKLFVNITENLTTDKFVLGDFTFFLSKQTQNKYEVRKLSNTYNMNVIFSIKLIKSQDINDLREFEAEL